MEQHISEKDFKKISSYIFKLSGITLDSSKRTMVSSRLARRLRHYNLEKYSDYFLLAMRPENHEEKQILIDLLTTNETYFFREMAHFDYLKINHLPRLRKNKSIRIWSAASSSGEEAYSIAMLLDDVLGETVKWEVFGSDICTQVIKTAQQGHYNDNRIQGIPPHYLKKYCLKGTGPYNKTLLVKEKVQKKVTFSQVNLNTTLPNLGLFDIIFLRNVMIYFSLETKQQIVNRIVSLLEPGGLFIIGHTETLKNVCDTVERIKPSIYQKPSA